MTSNDPADLLTSARAWLTANAPDVAAVQAWTARVLAEVDGPVPALGSLGWCALPDSDPRKLAAAVAPALTRLHENTPAAVALRLRRELRDVDRAVLHRVGAASHAVAGAQDWRAAAWRPTWDTLERRRWTRPCPACRTPLSWRADRCGCGWREPTPDEIRARATASWSHPPATTVRRAAA